MLPLRIAARFLRKSFAQTALIVAGIAVGIAVQVFVGSLIASLQQYLLDQTVGSSPHLTLTAAAEGRPIEWDEDLEELVRAEESVTEIAPVRRVNAIYAPEGGESAPLQLVGGPPEGIDGIYGLSDRVTSGKESAEGDGVLVGTDFAEANGIEVGDTIRVVLPDGKPAGLEVTGAFDLGVEEANKRTAFVSDVFAGQALGLGDGEYTAVEVQISDVFASGSIASRWRKEAAVDVADWQKANEQLLSGLRSQSSSSYIIQVFVVIAVALGIASTLTVSAVQKTRQIGILKAIGLSDVRAGAVFFWQAAILGLLGVGGGVALGYGLIEVFRLVGENSASQTFPIVAQPGFIAVSSAIGLGIALLSSVVPARNTARLDPIEVIQRG